MINDVTHHDRLVGDLIVAVFRLNGRLIGTGNQLVAGIGLTSAWWQVLGALAGSPLPLPVASIARNMGLSRQAVQRIADLLVERGLIRFQPNPHHQRAKLAALTTEGRAAVEAAQDCQRPLARQLLAEIGADRLAAAMAVLLEIDLSLARSGHATDQDVEQGTLA